MKRAVSLILVLVLCLGLCACGHSHAFGEWTILSEADCTTDGSRERVCECGEKETEVLKSSGHDFKAATAFDPKTCSVCGLVEGEPLAKLIQVGDTIEANDHSFTVEKINFTSKLKEKRGNITYTHGSNFVLAIKLKFTNKATSDFERWNSDRTEEISLRYMNEYTYEGDLWVPADDIVPLATDTIYVIYEVPESMSKDSKGAISATFTIDGETYAIVVQEGDGSAASAAPAEPTDVSGSLAVGDSKTNGATFSFDVKEIKFTKKLSYKKGNVTHSLAGDKFYLAVRLDFTNMSAETMEDWDSDRVTDISLTYDGKYNYEGRLWIPEDEIVPLATGVAFIAYEIPETIKDATEPVTFTFTVDGSVFTVNYR